MQGMWEGGGFVGKKCWFVALLLKGLQPFQDARVQDGLITVACMVMTIEQGQALPDVVLAGRRACRIVGQGAHDQVFSTLAYVSRYDGLGQRGQTQVLRSEERRVGKECVRTCGSRWWQYH